MDDAIKNVFQVAAWGVAAIGGVVSALLAIYQMSQNRRQRKEELRWKRALQAKTLLDEVFKSPKAYSALRMLDWSGRKYKSEDGENFVVTKAEFESHLRSVNLVFSSKEAYVRDSFDDLFTNLDMIEHYIKICLIQFDDVKVPFKYYVQKINENHRTFLNFLSFYGYNGTLNFLSRFPEWLQPPQSQPERGPDV